MKAARENWLDDQDDLDPEQLIFIDESGLSTKMARLRGWAPKGERCRAAIPHGHWKSAEEEGSLLRRMENSVAKAIAEVRRLGKKLAKDVPFEEVEKLTPLLGASIELASKTLLPLLEQVRQFPDAEGAFEKNYLPEALEKIVRLEASIDARINKVLARLVALKEFKRTPAGNPLAQLTASRARD